MSNRLGDIITDLLRLWIVDPLIKTLSKLPKALGIAAVAGISGISVGASIQPIISSVWKPAPIDYIGLTRVLKPNKDCDKKLSQSPSAKDIDMHLANGSNYESAPERHVWEVNLGPDGFKGSIWLAERGSKKSVAVNGFLSDNDWIVGADRGKKGRGVYYLNARDTQDVYYGWQIAVDCVVVDVILSCPYILGPASLVHENDEHLTKNHCHRWDRGWVN